MNKFVYNMNGFVNWLWTRFVHNSIASQSPNIACIYASNAGFSDFFSTESLSRVTWILLTMVAAYSMCDTRMYPNHTKRNLCMDCECECDFKTESAGNMNARMFEFCLQLKFYLPKDMHGSENSFLIAEE